MFGILRPCGHRLGEGLRAAWTAHLCGLCLALRAERGQFARTATNYDGLVVSVLVEAQTERGAEGGRRRAGPCPLRGMRTASVAHGEGARLAAAVSMALASAKVADHVADGDGMLGRPVLAGVARRYASSLGRAGVRTGAELGFDTGVLLAAAERQPHVEAAVGRREHGGGALLTVTEPTETAVAAAFAHTAVLAGRPANAAPLAEAGRLFGRLAHLLDAVEDLEEDARTGAWNPVAATGTSREEALRLCEDAVRGIALALEDVDLVDRRLTHVLLAHETRRAVDRAFGTRCSHDHGHGHNHDRGHGHGTRHHERVTPGHGPGGYPPPRPGRRRGPLAGCAVFAGLCCTAQVCCSSSYQDPWTGEEREGMCRQNCCEACQSCGDCCSCCGEGGCCDGCCCDGCGCDC